MSKDAETKSQAPAKARHARRDRLAAELRSNLHKRKARVRNIERLQEPKHDPEAQE